MVRDLQHSKTIENVFVILTWWHVWSECTPLGRPDSTGSNLCFPLLSVFFYTVCTRCSSSCPSLGTHYIPAFVPSPPQLPVVAEAWPGLCRLSYHWPRSSPSQTPARVFRVTRAKDGAWPHPLLLFLCPKSISEFWNSKETMLCWSRRLAGRGNNLWPHGLPLGGDRECKATFWELWLPNFKGA